MRKPRRPSRSAKRPKKLGFESLEARQLLTVNITTGEAQQLLNRAVVADARNDAIIAIVDRTGQILGVRVESGVAISDPATLDFAIDGAVAEARTAAYFSNNAGPGTALTSRTIRQISQTTITQREVQSDPDSNVTDPTLQGPGFVAPIGLGGHFPSNIAHTPPVDLFEIEGTNRAVLTSLGPDGQPDTADDVAYNIDPTYQAAPIPIPYSYGQQTGLLPDSDNRGIGTLPGGIPLYKPDPANGNALSLVGGIGVFFPGTTGYADFEQNFQPNNKQQTALDRTNAPLELEAEWIAFAAAGGSAGVGAGVGTLAGIPAVPGYTVPLSNKMKIFLAGISLDQVGQGAKGGVKQTLATGAKVGRGNPLDLGIEEPVDTGGDKYLPGQQPASGWLVTPHSGVGLTAAQVTQIINQGIATANQTRAQIRLPAGAASTRMVFSVVDTTGEVLGLYRMTDATIFSIDVAVAKARNVAYYASADLQPFDQVHVNDLNPLSPLLPIGTAFTNRTFRFLAEPRYPAGVDGSVPGAFSILREDWVDPTTGYNKGAPAPISDMQTVMGYDAFNPGTNFHDPNNPLNQNGVVFFPGSSPAYVGSILAGGFGVSGDGVDQDDVVTFFGIKGFAAPTAKQADQYFVRGTRLPYQKFSRNAFQI